jgi:predicted transcriptional regulator
MVSGWNGWGSFGGGGDFVLHAADAIKFPSSDLASLDALKRLQESVRRLARSLGRDVKRAHEDAARLINWGIIERKEQGKVCVPYDVIHAGFDLRVVT